MIKQNNNKKSYLFIFTILIMCILSVFALTFNSLLCTNVFAEETNSNLLTNSSVLSFNQLININSMTTNKLEKVNNFTLKGLQNATNVYEIANITNINFVSTHKYYVKCTTSQQFAFAYNGGSPVYFKNDTILSNNSGVRNQIFIYEVSLGTIYSFNVIDLTQMYGAGSEPTLEDIKNYNIFPTFYNRIDNLPITESLFTNNQSAYIQGYNDALSSFDVTIGTGNIYDTLSAYNYNGIQSTIDKTIINSGDYTSYLMQINGYAQLRLTATIDANTPVRIHLGALSTPNNSTYSVVDFYFLQNGTLNKFASIDTRTAPSDDDFFYIDVNWPTTSNMVFLKGQTSGYPNNNVYISNMQIEFKTINVYDIINNAYQNAERYYQQGQPGYNAIFQQGFDEGQRSPAIDSAWSFVSSTFSNIGGIFAVEFIPGVPLWVFIAIPLLFGLIVFLYRMTGGN